MDQLTVLDLFSGIGGFSLGLERAGMRTTAFCENDDACRKVLHKHWPGILKFKDIRDLRPEPGDYDVVCGGFPCQDISVAGKKRGLKGERSSLWFEFKRIVEKVRPKYAIVENVANLRNQGLNQILKDFWSIGYDCEWHIISARSIGACHLRERIWIVATNTNYTGRQRKDAPQPKGRGNKIKLIGADDSSDSDNFRLWKPFATTEEQSEWWAEATASFRDRWQVESPICRMDARIPPGLDKDRKERIKQLGNSLLPQIPELIGRAIVEHETKKIPR
jgi:DNA (cytosine-5)-methyltransferase 1